MSDFKKILSRILPFEPPQELKFIKGETSYGRITMLENPEWDGWKYTEKKKEVPVELIEKYYYYKHWCPLWCHLIDEEDIALSLFDFAVTTCNTTAIATMQQTVQVKNTGNMGLETIEMINCWDAHELIYKYSFERCLYYLIVDDDVVNNFNRTLAVVTN